MADDNLKSELERLKAENARLKSERGRTVSLKVSGKDSQVSFDHHQICRFFSSSPQARQ